MKHTCDVFGNLMAQSCGKPAADFIERSDGVIIYLCAQHYDDTMKSKAFIKEVQQSLLQALEVINND
jgi:hypothetical protein